jgi:hypothetical protein
VEGGELERRRRIAAELCGGGNGATALLLRARAREEGGGEWGGRRVWTGHKGGRSGTLARALPFSFFSLFFELKQPQKSPF